MPYNAAAFSIPVLRQADVLHKTKGRMYSADPLPLSASTHAPRQAQIVDRVVDGITVAYTLSIGGNLITDVGAHEILDFVSANDLEEFETHRFNLEIEHENEEQALQLQLEEEDFLRRLVKVKRRNIGRPRKLSRPVVVPLESDVEESTKIEAIGKHGRARPSYTNFYLPVKERQRRRRDPVTNELIPLEQFPTGTIRTQSNSDDLSDNAPDPNVALQAASGELPKRRRRKRDKITGELLPLSPSPDEKVQPKVFKSSEDVVAKRPRRRRHPITRELMPLGWRYDDELADKRQDTEMVAPHDETSANDNDALVESERQWHESPASTSSLRQDHRVLSQPGLHTSPIKQPLASTVMHVDKQESILSAASSSSDLVTLAQFFQSQNSRQARSTLSEQSDTDARPDQMALPRTPAKTSLLHPVVSHRSPSSQRSELEEDLFEGEWYVEKILSHHLSDPQTHPTDLGKRPVMLYQVKWEGYDDPTWEPYESFGDPSMVDEYRRKNRLGSGTKTRHSRQRSNDVNFQNLHDDVESMDLMKHDSDKATLSGAGEQAAEDTEQSSNDQNDGYEIEAILDHRLSDPRSHPGKPATMLYCVKWAGHEEVTWEPIASFVDAELINMYRQKHGIAG